MSTTQLALVVKFGDTNIPLLEVCETYFGLSSDKALDKARTNTLPVPVYRLGTQKSQWFMDAKILADYIDQKKTEALREWRLTTGN